MKKSNKSSSQTVTAPSLTGRAGGESESSEIWKTIPGFPRYEVSNKGRVRSNCCHNGRKVRFVLKAFQRVSGYLCVDLCIPDPETGRVKVKHMDIHRLVTRAFIGKCKKGRVVDHISGDRLDNRLENLRYASLSENQANKHNDRYKDGFRIEIFRDGVFFAEVTTRKALLDTVGKNYKYRNTNSGSSLNALFNTGRTWRYKNFYAVLVLPHDEVELGPAPHVQFKFEV